MPTETVPNDAGVVDRRRFFQVMGGGAAAVGLTACADDGNDRLSPMAQRAAERNADIPALGSTSAATPGATSATSSASDLAEARTISITPTLTRLAELQPADASEAHMAYAPNVPPAITRTDQRIVEFSIDVLEGVCEIDPEGGVSVDMWGFRIGDDTEVTCGVPGPILRARVGDLAKITVTNSSDSANAHNIDFHAVTGQGGGAEGTIVAPGESATINARLLYPGAFMYHCAFGDVPMHIAHGMYGMFIVDPEEPLPAVDHEWSLMQSEWYVGEPDADGKAPFDPEAMRREEPRYVTFNGRTNALTGDNSLQMNVGERARIYMVNEGLNLTSNFHPIGSHWDVVYPEAATHPINRVIRGSQSTSVVAGGGTVTELVGQVPSTIVLVDHALVRTFYKGCIGMIVINGDENALFTTGADGLAQAAASEPAPPADAAPGEVVIPDGAWDPANAANAYTPTVLAISVGTEVTWRNTDTMVHTVTSGNSTGQAGTADGLFDSGLIQPDGTFRYTFGEAGTFDYFCTPHPWMQGQVVVS